MIGHEVRLTANLFPLHPIQQRSQRVIGLDLTTQLKPVCAERHVIVITRSDNLLESLQRRVAEQNQNR